MSGAVAARLLTQVRAMRLTVKDVGEGRGPAFPLGQGVGKLFQRMGGDS